MNRMTILREGLDSTSRRLLPAILLLAAVLFAGSGASGAFAITRESVLSRAQSWVDVPVPYSQTHWFRGYRTDCSGFCSMAWMTRSAGHPYSYSTRSLHDVSRRITVAELQPGDAMLRNKTPLSQNHVRIFYGWVDAAHTSYVAYEQTGPRMKSSIKSLASDLGYGYLPYRYNKITAGPPAWNAVANPTFDVWASGSPVWWQVRGVGSTSACTRTVDATKASRSALGLINASARSRDVVEAVQTGAVTPGARYTLSLWANTDAAPSGLQMRLQFLDASGRALVATSTTGAIAGIGPIAFGQMSLTATVPAEATSATVTVRLAGGVDASGTAGTTAVIDEVRLYMSASVSATCTISQSRVARRHSVILRGRVDAPIPFGTVRVYAVRPGSTKTVAIGDRTLVGGAWSMRVLPTMRGRYTFRARYLGWGPYAAVTTPAASLRVY